MKSIKNNKSSIKLGQEPTIVAKNASIRGKSAKTKSLPISDGLDMYLYDAGDSARKFIRMDFNDYSTYDDFYMIMDRQTLRKMAEFITNYLDE